jgi:GntR family transcriptional regulator/MocR family aminotransferase
MALPITLDYEADIPLHHQLYDQMRGLILSGKLSSGKRLPSTRLLADSLGLARATVAESYDRLSSEGYIHTVPKSGTFVSESLPEHLLASTPVQNESGPSSPPTEGFDRLSAFGRAVMGCDSSFQRNYLDINFGYGPPDLEHFPLEQWRRLLLAHCRKPEMKVFGYCVDYAGYVGLREAVAGYLSRARAVRCTPEQVVITNGSQQALDLVARILLDRGDYVAMENPGYFPMRLCCLAQGANIFPVPIDEHGMVVSHLPQSPSTRMKMAYVTPSHQYPTGTVLPLSRRLELLNWAAQNQVMVVEDDYDSEFRYAGRPLPSLQGIDKSDCVIYMGTFSKILFPAIRLGYLVLPDRLAGVFTKAKVLADRQAPMLEQYALTDFINEGHMERHIRKMRMVYEKRRNATVESFKEFFGDCASILGENSGMSVLVRFNTGLPDHEVQALAAKERIGIITAAPMYHEGYEPGEFLMGYSDIPEERIRDGIQRLHKALKEVLKPVRSEPSMSA